MTRTWLITGGSGGLGRALATAVLEVGDALVVTAEPAADLGDLVAAHGPRIRVVVPDPSERSPLAGAVATALDEFGRLDVAVHLPMVTGGPPAEELTENGLFAQLDTSLAGAVQLAREVLPAFRGQGAGHVLLFAPPGGRTATLAVQGLAEDLQQMAGPGIRVTAVEPGGAGTDDVPPEVPRLAGDPARAARVLVDFAGTAHAPLRLVLGAEAAQLAEQSARARLQELVLWSDVSRSAGGPGPRPRGLAPVLHLMAPAAG